MKYKKFDIMEHLDSEEAFANYLSAVRDEGDPDLLLAALVDIARVSAMAKLVKDFGSQYQLEGMGEH